MKHYGIVIICWHYKEAVFFGEAIAHQTEEALCKKLDKGSQKLHLKRA